MSSSSLVQIDISPKPRDKRGCSNCPLNNKKGIHKVLGKVRGRKIMLWAQSPGMQENKGGKELIGPAGKFLWHELKRVGITRDDVDIQNVVRCVPADYNPDVYPTLRMRAPTKEEVKSCSIYNEQALGKCKAKLHLVFGAIAGASLLGKEYNKDKRVFYSEALKSWVVYLDHPAYFIRMGYTAGSDKQPNDALLRFRSDLSKAKQLKKRKSTDRYYFIKHLDSRGITNSSDARRAYRKLKEQGEDGNVLVFDTEEGKVDKHGKPDDNGKWVPLCVGFITKKTSYTFALEHPDSGISYRCKKLNYKLCRKLLANTKIAKSAHYSAHDTNTSSKMLGTEVKGRVYDTLLGEFFFDPNAKAYGLEKVSERKFPDYMGYKEIKYPDALTLEYRRRVENRKGSAEKKVDTAEKTDKQNLARLPWKKMILYNGADCHLEKLSERSTVASVNPPLMGVYVDAGEILYKMQSDPLYFPKFDYRWFDKIKKLLYHRFKVLRKKVVKLAGHGPYTILNRKTGKERIVKKFNPRSHDQMYWLIYSKLRIPASKEEKNTQAGTLQRLGIKYPKVNRIWQMREADKAYGMAKSYRNCANRNNRALRTIWKSTGTSTGRLSSGKTKDRKDDGVINFQNIHGDPLIRCLFVASEAWRKVYKHWLKFGDFTNKSWKKFKNIPLLLGFDFSQNELRQLAEESNDKALIKMFSSGKDPHVEIGHEITGWPKKEIAENDRVRKLVKNIQFGLVFGLQGEGLYAFIIAKGVKTTLKEVMEFHAKYFKRFPGVKKLQKYYRAFAEKHGYVVNVFGFKRKLGVNDNEDEETTKGGGWWGNQAINTPIQGASHQLLMMVIAALKRKADKYKLLKYVLMEIHDALYFRIKLKYLLKGSKLGMKLMTKEPVEIVKNDFKMKKRVPLEAKPKAGFRFGVQLEGIGGKGLQTIPEFLNAWCRENRAFEKGFKKQLAAAA